MTEERKYRIATGKSRYERVWRNREVTWERLRRKLMEPTVTGETMAEYRKMSRDRQGNVKDVGGFVGGYLRNGERKAGSVESRSLVCLDYDTFGADRLGELREALRGQQWALHSTHKHTDAAWRVRVIIPLQRDASADEYGAVARKLAEKIGFGGIDRSTFEASRLMYWPSRSTDAPYLYEEGEGEPADVDAILGGYRDWRDMSEWPLLPEEEAALGEEALGFRREALVGASGTSALGPKHSVEARGGRPLCASGKGAAEDPRKKGGLVGAWCRTYDVEAVIRLYLENKFRRVRAGRYTYVGSTTSAGAWVIEGGRYLYSYHSTDPWGGRLLNSWDLVRLHLFGDGKESRGRMEELALADATVKGRLIEERRQRVVSDFYEVLGGDSEAARNFGLRPKHSVDLEGDSGADAVTSALGPKHGDEAEGAGEAEPEASPLGAERSRAGEAWARIEGNLDTDKRGNVKGTITNARLIIEWHPDLRGKLRYDEFAGNIVVGGELPWRRGDSRVWTNNDASCLRAWLDEQFGLGGKEKIDDGFVAAVTGAGYHPVKDYLGGLEWDGEQRLRRLFTEVLGAEDSELNRTLAEMFFAAAVRRIYEPGVKFDYMPVLCGEQGSGKSSLFRIMGGEWFTDSIKSFSGKEGMEQLQGNWIVEIGEMSAYNKSELEQTKSFISSERDKFRPAYGRYIEERPRQCVLVGTTNERTFLRGIDVGNRRHPVVDINPGLSKEEGGVWAYAARWRDQLWAEAKALSEGGYPLYLSKELEAASRKTQEEHNSDLQNALFPEVDRYLELCLPRTWDSWKLGERQEWLRTSSGSSEEESFGFERREYVTVAEVLQECMELRKGDREYNRMGREVGKYLNSLRGRWRFIGTHRTRLYGSQKSWQRVTENESGHNSVTDSVTLLDEL